MADYDFKSQNHLDTCHPDLKKVFTLVQQFWPHRVIEGHRTLERQAQLLAEKKTQVKFGKHNVNPSDAVDVAPLVDGKPELNDREQLSFFAGFVLATACSLGIKLRWGGDWNQNLSIKDNAWDDLFHYERVV